MACTLHRGCGLGLPLRSRGGKSNARVSPEQLHGFLEHVRGDPLYAAWLLFATTGMRRGEVAGLRWPDVDLHTGRISPRRPRVGEKR